MQQLWKQITDIVGSRGILEGADVLAREGWADYDVQATRLVRPASTAEVSRVLALCHSAGQGVVPHGGRTGLVAGCNAAADEIVLSTERMNGIDPPNTVDRTVCVGAGAILQNVHEVAADSRLVFPVDLGARGSATIGGLIATNAGGNGVIRYGMMRANVLGLEAVLADGTVISSMNRMLKNNAGYDLKQLFIGTEGTLGFVTRAVLRLQPAPTSIQSALVGLESFENLTRLLSLAVSELSGGLCTFEALWQSFYRRCVTIARQPPLGPDFSFYALVECEGTDDAGTSERFQAFLETALESGIIADAALAQSEQDRSDFWAIRDNIEGLYTTGPLVNFDVSMPLEEIEAYVDCVLLRLDKTDCDSPVCVFGHLGDGNIHITVPMREPNDALYKSIMDAVYEPLAEFQGSISGEHGIGTEKISYLHLSRSAEEIALMKNLKTALDPKGILNAGKVFLRAAS